MKSNFKFCLLPVIALFALNTFALEEVHVYGTAPSLNNPFTLEWFLRTTGPGGGLQSPMQGAEAGYSTYEKVKHCLSAKGGGIATDVKECINQVNLEYNFTVRKCNTYGTINWTFNYSGVYMKSTQAAPYPIPSGTHETACGSLVKAVANAAITSCEISGERALQRLNSDPVCATLQ